MIAFNASEALATENSELRARIAAGDAAHAALVEAARRMIAWLEDPAAVSGLTELFHELRGALDALTVQQGGL